MPQRLADVRKRCAEAGVPRTEIDDEINARKAKWQEEKPEALQQLNAADRRNERRFDDVTDEMFRRLYHEAFHAYLENYLYPTGEYEVPVWLHEGLAQLFQSGQLESDTLRVDAPLASALRAAQEDFQSELPLGLADLLSAKRNDFLADSSEDDRANHLYAAAWALVYYLAFYDPVLGTEAFDEFIAAGAEQEATDDVATIERFQKLMGKPLFEVEQQWRTTILKLQSAR
jgi:hypothetical protein